MSNLYTIKDHFKESQLYLNRTIAATVIVLALLALLISRLVVLQIYQHDFYKTLSLNNQVRINPITPPRGLIYDRKGVLLAENIPAFSLELTPERTADIDATLQDIRKIIPFTDAEERQFYKQLKYKRRNEAIPIRVKLTEEEVAKFSIEKYRFPGVEVVARLIRHYPLGLEVAHPLGYIGPISERDQKEIDANNYRGTYYIGKTGVEKFYENELHGKPGYQHIETDAKGRTIRVLSRIQPVPGANLYLSIDSQLQRAAIEIFKEYKGAIVVMDPNNGDILAMVSHPSFDPNLFTQGINVNTYRELQSSPTRPLFNRAIRGQYPPGSTIKPVIAVQALDIGTVTPSFKIFDPGFYQLNGVGRLYRCHIFHSKKRGHGTVDLDRAIIHSCDTYFFTVANKMGIGNLNDIFGRFGLGELSGIDMVGESKGTNPSVEWKKRVYHQPWWGGDTLNIGIGQGLLLTTPLQMATVASTLANRGERTVPRMVTAIDRELSGKPETLAPKTAENVGITDEEIWHRVIDAMYKVVHGGGTAGRISAGLQYTIAGKTGTAQVFNLKQNEKYEVSKVKEHLRDHSWFIGFAPVENPKVAIAVILENYDKTKPASVIARSVLDNYFYPKPIVDKTKAKAEAENASDKKPEQTTTGQPSATGASGTTGATTQTDRAAAEEDEEDEVGGAEEPDADEAGNQSEKPRRARERVEYREDQDETQQRSPRYTSDPYYEDSWDEYDDY